MPPQTPLGFSGAPPLTLVCSLIRQGPKPDPSVGLGAACGFDCALGPPVRAPRGKFLGRASFFKLFDSFQLAFDYTLYYSTLFDSMSFIDLFL